jgi:hypothetical protein
LVMSMSVLLPQKAGDPKTVSKHQPYFVVLREPSILASLSIVIA